VPLRSRFLTRVRLAALVVLIAIPAIPGHADAQRQCRKGKPCGDTCIARDKTCHVGQGSAVWAPGTDTTTGDRRRASARPRDVRPTSTPAVAPVTPIGPTATCVVAHVTDGDTLRCADGRKVRLLLIDAPERDQGEFGGAARAALESLAPPGAAVMLELDVERTDRYGRTLAYVYLPDGRMANEQLARAGYVVPLVYPPNVQHVERMRAAVAAVREERRGLWATSAFECAPRDHRRGRCD
jgi:micrococcal nuclease